MKRFTALLLGVWLLLVVGNELVRPIQAAEVPLIPVPEEEALPSVDADEEVEEMDEEEEIRLFGSTSSDYIDPSEWAIDDDEEFNSYYYKNNEIRKETLSEEIDDLIKDLVKEEEREFEKNFVYVGVKGDFVLTKLRVCLLIDDIGGVQEMLDTFSKERLFPVGDQSPFLIPMSDPMQRILTSYFESKDDMESLFLLNMGQLLEYTKQLQYTNLVRHVHEGEKDKVMELLTKLNKSK